MALTASTFSSEYMVDYDGHESSEISGPEAKGTGPLSRLYRTFDGWLALSADHDGDWQRLTSLEPFAALSHPANPAELETIFATRPTSEWTSLLREAGIPAAANRTLADIRSDDPCQGRRPDCLSPPPGIWGRSSTEASPLDSASHPSRAGTSPVFGGDTSAILTELGYSECRDRLHTGRWRNPPLRRPAPKPESTEGHRWTA